MSRREIPKSVDEAIRVGFAPPVYFDEQPAAIRDGSEPSTGSWTSANAMTLRLLRCLEPVRDLNKQLEVIAAFPMLAKSKRFVKSLSIPIHNLAERTIAWMRALTLPGAERLKSKTERAEVHKWIAWLAHAGIVLDKADKPDFTLVRDKISAHIDSDAVSNPQRYWDKVNLVPFLWKTDLLVIVLTQLLDLDHFAWSKLDTPDHVWTLMSVDGTTVDLIMEDGRPTFIAGVTFTESPKAAVFRELQAVQRLCKKLLADLATSSIAKPESR